MIIILIGNIGTHKSTYARHISDSLNALIADDDELYYTLSNKSWKYYYSPIIQKIVERSIEQVIRDCYFTENKDIVVPGAGFDFENFIWSTINQEETIKIPRDKIYVVITGNGSRELSLANRKNNSRGCSIEEWASVWDKYKTQVERKISFAYKYIDCADILHLENSMDTFESIREIDDFIKRRIKNDSSKN